MPIATTNPATGEVLKTYDPMSDEQVDGAIERADLAFRQLHGTTIAQRGRWLIAAAELLEAERDETARLMTTEMGKTYAAAKAEVTKCAAACRFYAASAPEMLADEPADAGAVKAKRAYVRYQPIGPVLAVMPWNFPLWQVMRFAAPALMAGNTGLLKHASNVPQTALYLEDLFRRAGFPEGAFTTLLVGSEAVDRILSDPRVRAATLTGSEGAGRSIARIAGRELKKTVLELGGSDPFVVMPSADLDRAAEVATTARCQNNGQSCIAAKRFIVHRDVFDAFAEKFTARMAALTVGDPMDEGTDVGPLATDRGRDEVHAQVRDAADKGARVLCGGELPAGDGWYYPPTVVTDLRPEMRMWSEEVFGPVAGLFRVSSYEEAIEVANGTHFGLGSNAWTTDPAEQERFATDLDAGNVFINGMTTSFPQLPFGGVKNSGYGRELSALGMREFCNIKTVWIGEGEAGPGAGAHAE
ncbi:NADP-dependent succinic semialdehyde dehydrogenase [Micromonospora sp. DR5-3]|uniref:NADP-dependent succinic semialdehyde dehydrogenase n=1 Tax=unclassified Micromonospora TaxID=2617518 RepID=UPI0011D449FD|nr:MULTISPECIES: NADP-dependent succinic semialdehyde dehydrogenase [unclassified Micromonospora]MCW3817557.1 NADP-dependent succinic semialdehyde dehydrogenase [Micromonospora sp. DR5-3]TYC25267.1 NADP-dependent succinic semialdehyde dehydrogenase [Micromonospora sp. MP36]